MSANRPAGRREIFAWAMYDFANSGYTTVVLTTIFSAFFVAVIAAGLPPGRGTFLWTLAIGIANFIVLLCAPVVGAIADHRAMKKRLLAATTIGCVGATALLFHAGSGDVLYAMLLLILSAICFSLGESLIAAFLPEIAPAGKMGRISGYGWGVGYLGGLLTLGICLVWISRAKAEGLPATEYVPVTLLITAIIFALSASPTFLWLRERAVAKPAVGECSTICSAFRRVAVTLREAARHKDLFRFLLSLIVFQAGVATVVVLAAVYAQEVMGFDSQQLVVLIMVVNVTAAAGALLFGHAQDRFGSVSSLTAALLVWITAVLVIFVAQGNAGVWIAGNLIGAAMGATQAGGRALIGELTPVARSGEFFGLWGLANRVAAIVGPLSYGVISWLSEGNHRLAILSTLTFFVVGLLLLLRVDETRGKIAANN
ncbi:MAG: MFS transporter [Pseudomonadota bacterium]